MCFQLVLCACVHGVVFALVRVYVEEGEEEEKNEWYVCIERYLILLLSTSLCDQMCLDMVTRSLERERWGVEGGSVCVCV